MMKRLLCVLLVLAMLLSLSLLLISCQGEQGEKGEKGDKGETGAQGVKGDTGERGAAGATPKFKVNNQTGMWEISYDEGATWTSLSVKAQGENGVTPKLQISATTGMWEVSYDSGVSWISTNVAAQGPIGMTPKLQINSSTGMWEVSYDNGVSWSSLGVKAQGEAGAPGAPGSQISIGQNGNWFINGNDTGFKASDASPAEFVPVLRFAVSSDLHLRATDYDYRSAEMLDGLFDTAYAYSLSQKYQKLDAILFAGDFTENGAEAEMTKFFDYVNANTRGDTVVRAVLGNHEYYSTEYDDGTTSDDRYSDTSVANTYANFLRISGYESVDAHMVIGGYHFIVLNTDRYALDYNGSKFSPAKLAWLETELAAAAADDPTGKKPIFVFQHMPATGTVNNTFQYSGDDYLEAIFNQYPQVVDFSGHTHFPITDPQSVWQGGYTAVNTASLAYLCTYIAGHPTYNDTVTKGSNKDSYVVPTDWEGSWNASGSNGVMRNAGLYYMVEVNAEQEVRLVVYNIYSCSVQMIIYIGKVGDPSEFTYTDARKNAAAPTFSANAELTPQLITKNYALINIPQASCEAGVNNYRIALYKGSTPVSTTYRLSCAFLGFAMPSVISAPLTGLTPSTSYTVKVYPVNNWGKEGEPLSYRFTTASSLADPVADVLSVSFNLNDTATNAITGKHLDKAGNPVVAYDETIGRNVAILNGSSGYAFHDMFQHYDRIKESFTLETYIYIENKPSAALNIISNMESGGFGFQYSKTGEVQILAHGTSGYDRAVATLPLGEWVHVVGVYTGTKVQLYFNGQLMDEVDATKTSWTIPKNGSHYLSVGGDSSPSVPNGTNFFTGKMAVANLYSDALTATEIAALYQKLS